MLRYIEWLEQNFPKGGKESHLPQVLEACVEKFRNEKQYHNDARLIDIWIKFVSHNNNGFIITFLYFFFLIATISL